MRKISQFRLVFALTLLAIFISHGSYAQKINAEYERFSVAASKYIHSGMAMSPDLSKVAIACTQGFPLYIYDYKSRALLNQFDVGNWYAGSRVSWSSGGKYLLLQQLFYLDFAKNKDREVNFEIIDANTGERVVRFEKYHDVKISPDDKLAYALTGNTLEIWDLSSAKVLKTRTFGYATNSISISPDGRFMAISERASESALKNDPQFKKNKKGMKFVLKYKQLISIYNLSDLSYVTSVNEYYDNIYRLDWTHDGKYIFCLNIPHAKATTATSGRQNFISVIDAVKFEATRIIFPSNSLYEPDFKQSHNKKLMAIVSWGKFAELRIHDFETGAVVHRLEMGTRVMEGISKLEMPSDGRIFIEFMPGDKSLLATFGNQMLLWNLPEE